MACEMEWVLPSTSMCMTCGCSGSAEEEAVSDVNGMGMFSELEWLEVGEVCSSVVIMEGRRDGEVWESRKEPCGASNPNTCRVPLVIRFLGDISDSPLRGDLEEGRGGKTSDTTTSTSLTY